MTPAEMERVYVAYESCALSENQFGAVVSMMTNVEKLRMVEFIAKRRKRGRGEKRTVGQAERSHGRDPDSQY